MSIVDTKIHRARITLAAAHRLCVRLGYHEAIDGHMSLQVPCCEEDQILLSPFPLHWSEVTASSIQRISLVDGAVIEGAYTLDQPSWCVHSALHRHHPRHRCFIHTHMPYATAITCRMLGRLQPVHQHLIGLYHEIAYFDEYCGEVLDEEYGNRIARALGARSVIFLANHGVIAGGATPAHALKRLYYTERACQFQILAESGNHPLRLLEESLFQAPTYDPDPELGDHAYMLFEAWLRILDREEPNYAH